MRPWILALFALLLTAPSAHANCPDTVLDSTLRRLTGAETALCDYRGKVLLVVNTASHCGFTPQFEGLEALYQRYRDQGLVVLGIPSDQFGGQEFDKAEDTATFCKVNYGVSFPMFAKSAVKGPEAIPLYQALAAATGSSPRWNFHKYLVGRDGHAIAAWTSLTKPESDKVITALEAALAAPSPETEGGERQ